MAWDPVWRLNSNPNRRKALPLRSRGIFTKPTELESQDGVVHEMQLHPLRTLGRFKITRDRVGNHLRKLGQRFALRGDTSMPRLVIPACNISAGFRTGRNIKDDRALRHDQTVGQRLLLCKSSSGDGGNDADFFAGLDGGFLVLEEADVFAVNVDIHEAADVAFVVEEALANAGVTLVETGEEFGDGGALNLDGVEVIGQGPERGGDGDRYGHRGEGGS